MEKFCSTYRATRSKFLCSPVIRFLTPSVLFCFILLCQPVWSAEEAKAPTSQPDTHEAKGPQPEKVLRETCDFLKSLKKFSFKAEVTDDQVYRGGKKLQFSFDLEAFVQRPDKLRINAEGDMENKQFFYDGSTITLYDTSRNVYASIGVPATIDGALDKAHKEFGLRVALADLAASEACDLMAKGVASGLYVGLHQVRGVKCHHLAFDRPDVHWQIWIDAGDKPLPRKIVITQKKLQDSPQWTASISDWNFSPQFDDALFVFTPPKGASKIKFVPIQQAAKEKPKANLQQEKGGKK